MAYSTFPVVGVADDRARADFPVIGISEVLPQPDYSARDDGLIWLYDRDVVLTDALPEYKSVITTLRFSDHSEWGGRFPEECYEALAAAFFVEVANEDEFYLIERVELVSEPGDGGDPYVEASGRSATALLSTRTVLGSMTWASAKQGQIVSDLMGSLTGPRAIAHVSFGTGTDLGTLGGFTAANGDMGEVMQGLLASAFLGMRARRDGSTVLIDVYAMTEADSPIGDAYDNATSGKLVDEKAAWKNYAFVRGQDDIVVEVDSTSGAERREVDIDATSAVPRTVDDVTATEEDYRAALGAYGLTRLADFRRVEYAEASTDDRHSPGTVAWYDSERWSAWFMVSELKTTREGGQVLFKTVIGEPPAGLKKSVRRYVK